MSTGGVILFCDPLFPGYTESAGLIREQAERLGALHHAAHNVLAVRTVDADQLDAALDAAGPGGCFINMHAPYFPKEAWGAILAYLKRGGGLLNIGGAPFKHPVRRQEGVWLAEAEQTAYHRQLHIHEALRVDGGRVQSHAALADIPLFAGREGLLNPADTWNLVPHVTKSSDLPEQMGASGPMDTRIYPLLKGLTAEGREVSAPAVLWEHVGGPFAGGRWIFIGQRLTPEACGNAGQELLAACAAFAAKGVTELWLKPNYASYEQGERPVISVQSQRLSRARTGATQEIWQLQFTLQKDGASRPLL